MTGESIDAAIPHSSSQPPTGSMGNHGVDLFGTTTVGIIVRGMVILAAEGRVSRDDATKPLVRDDSIKLEWVMDSVFVARCGMCYYTSKIIETVRNICKDNPPPTIEAIVKLLVEESNKELSTIMKDPSLDASTHKWALTVGGKLHTEKDCKLFLVYRHKRLQSFVSSPREISGDHVLIGGSGEDFFTKDIMDKLVRAHYEYDRALLSEIVKAYIADSCAKDEYSGGRLTMVTIDDRGFLLFESADLVNPKYPSKGYGASEFDEFYPVGYRTG